MVGYVTMMGVAKERLFTEVLNLRIDDALNSEIKRIAGARQLSDSDAARLLLGWGVEAHRAMEARELRRPYDAPNPEEPMRMVIDVHWVDVDPAEYDLERKRGHR
jgi:hypothetical protein